MQRLGTRVVLVRMVSAAIAAAALVSTGCPKKAPEAVAAAAAPAAPVTPEERAVALYDEGKYEEARAAIEALDPPGGLSGPLLYRLGYCYGAAGDAAKQSETMARALASLQEEAKTRSDLETGFFLANAQTNLGKLTEARATASGLTSRIEKGEIPSPTRPIDQFRIGKLYADQGRKDKAAEWYGRALGGFAATGATAPGYVRWARRWLGQEAFQAGKFADAEEHYEGLASAGGATPAEYDRLAVCRARLGKWTPAAQAWREAERLDPANADRPRYARNLAVLAGTAGPLPVSAPSGQAWSALSKEDLERILSDHARVAREGRARASADPAPDAAARKEIEDSLAKAQPLFAAAALEYLYRNLDLRETAFLGGYAPLIFHPEDWKLPTAEP
jgi:tetratricopeptide (TPR) repeat protein